MIYGLLVESELRLTSVDEVEGGDAEPAIRVVLGSPQDLAVRRPAGAADPDDWVQHAVLDDGGVYMKSELVFEALISPDGRDVVCRKLGDVDQRAFEANLMNFVLSASLTLRGEEPLHATVVELEGRAIGLLGLSGAGKSTLAAYLISRGADLITDDMLRVAFVGDAVLAYPGPYRLKLLEEAGNRYLPAALADGHFNPLSGKIMVRPREAVKAGRWPVPLSALLHIGDPDGQGEVEGVSSVRLAGVDLATIVISSTMDTRYALPDRLARQIRFAARVAGVLPVHQLRYPRRFDIMDKVADEIRRVIRA